MIRKDFENGGFPVNQKNPIICVADDYKVYLAHDNFTLKQILETKVIKKVIGIWPGKHNTDCFPIKIEACGKIAPPAKHKDIDSASSISIAYKTGGEFCHVSYVTGDGTNVTQVTDPALESYIKLAGLKATNVYL